VQERVLLEDGSLGIRAAMRAGREVEWEAQVPRRSAERRQGRELDAPCPA